MQTTLLGVAIAIILAFVSALVAPLVVDWNRYRSVFEEEASQLTGLAVRVNGKIEASILPTPHIKLRNVEVGEPGRESQIRAGTVELEVGFGPLLRGEVRATQARIVAPQINLGLDASGAVKWPARWPSFKPDALTFSRLDVEDGVVVLSDATSGSRIVLQKLWFSGDIHSFIGPFKGEGAFVVGDQLYGYRISGSRADEDGGFKLRLGVDPTDRPLTTEIEGTLSLDRGIPQFDGILTASRPAGATLAHGERVMSDPWELAGKLRATPASISLQELVLQYGPEERAANFGGKAKLTLGAHPHLDGSVSARQVDVDRALADPDVTHRPPLLVIKSFFEAFVAAVKPPLPMAVGVALDAVTVGGTSLQSVRGNVRFDDKGWSLDGFDFRAPGFTQVAVTGRLDNTPQGLAFSGPASIESADLKMLMAWLEGRRDRNDPPSAPTEALTAHGDITIASNRVAVDRLVAVADQESLAGRLAYTWAVENHPASLDGELHAQELDVDAMTAFARTAVSDSAFELPREVTLVLDLGRVTFAGVEAHTVNAQVKFDAGALRIDRLSVGALAGAALDISGRIDELSSHPRGRVTFAVDANTLDGLITVVGRFAPQVESLHAVTDRLSPAKLHGVLVVDRAAAGAGAKLTLDGQVGATRLALNGDATGDLAQPGNAVVRIDSKLDADDGGALVRLLGLDHVVAVDQLPGQMTISANGPLNGDLHVKGLAVAGGFSMTGDGVLRMSGEETPRARLKMKASASDLRPLALAMTGQPSVTAPVAASANVTVAGPDVSLTDLAVAVGKTLVHGRLSLKLSRPIGIDGDLNADDVDASALAAVMLGLPNAAPRGSRWSNAPIGAGAFAAMNGAVTFKLDRAALTPALIVGNLSGVARFEPAQIAVSDIKGNLAGGRLSGGLAFRHDSEEFSAQGGIELAGANAAALLKSNTNAIDGQLTLKLQGDSLGITPQALIGALHGSGTINLSDAHFVGIDTAAFDAAARATDLSGGATEASKVQAAVHAAMDNSKLAVPSGEANVTIAGGQIRLANATLPAQHGAELSLSGNVDLNDTTIDARMTLSGEPAANALIHARPELAMTIKGPLATPARTIDISALLGWLTLRSAELQTRRLELIELSRREETLSPAVRPPSPAIRFVPQGTPLESDIQANAAPSSPFNTRALERLLPETPSPAATDPRADAGPADHGDPAATASVSSGEPSKRRVAPPPPPAARSLFDLLFRPQN